MNTPTFNPFLHYSEQLNLLFTKANNHSNPALWLFQNNVRTPIFMLEALTRIHAKATNKKLFDKWNKRFKKLEDIFGAIDYYAACEKEFKGNKKISTKTISYFTINKNKLINKCNEQLKQKQWFDSKLNSFNTKICTANITYDQEFLNALKKAIQQETSNIRLFCANKNYSFLLLEKEVHELRRKLRWLSIYAQALNGLIQLKKSSKVVKYELNYFTKNILNSPYNKLPIKPKNFNVIEFDTNSFFALSWVINELGILKDKGLSIQALADAIFYTEELTEYQAKEKAFKLLGVNPHIEETILKQASSTVFTYLTKDKLLDKLLII